MDEAAISRALKHVDRDYSLQKRPRDEAHGGVLVYKVVHVPTGLVCFTWIDEHGRPLPLSSGLIDEFQRHMVGARNSGLGVDEYNRRLIEQGRRDHQRETENLIGDHRGRVERGQLQVSLAYRNRKPSWLKEHRGRLAR